MTSYSEYVGRLEGQTNSGLINAILAEIETYGPGSGANNNDYAVVLASLVDAVGEYLIKTPMSTNIKVILGGTAIPIAVDSITNIYENPEGWKIELAKGVISGLVGSGVSFAAGAAAATLGSGLLLSIGSIGFGFMIGNKVANAFGALLEFLFGDSIAVVEDPAKIDPTLFTADIQYRFIDMMVHSWENADPKQSMQAQDKYRVYIKQDTGILDMTYVKNENKYTFTSQPTTKDFKILLRFLKRNDEINYQIGQKIPDKVVLNLLAERYVANSFNMHGEGLSESEIIQMVKTDKEALFAALARKEYVLESEVNSPGYNTLDQNIYSNEMKDNLAKYLHYRTLCKLEEEGILRPEGDYFYVDINDPDFSFNGNLLGMQTPGRPIIGFGGGNNQTLDISYTSHNNYLFGRVDGDEKYNSNGNYDDILKSGGGNDYIEGGIGSDSIYAGAGHDTIYTNSDIDSAFDMETDSTENKVYAGDGNDTIFGSKGSDYVYGEDGNDVFIIKDDDFQYDTFIGGEGDDAIEGGAGDDTVRVHEFINIEGGDDHRVEIIDGKGGKNTLAGTANGDIIDLSETELINIQEINLGGGNDKLQMSEKKYDAILKLIDGGAGTDTLTNGTETWHEIDLTGLELKGIENIDATDRVLEIKLTNSKFDTIEKIEFGVGEDSGQESPYFDISMSGAQGDRIDKMIGGDNVSRFDLTNTQIKEIGTIDVGDKYNTIDLSGAKSESIKELIGGTGQDTFTLNNTEIKSIDLIELGDCGENENKLVITGGTIETIGQIKGGKNDDTVEIKNGIFKTIDTLDLGDGKNTLTVEGLDGTTIKTLTGGKEDDTLSFVSVKNLTIDSLKTGDGDNKVDFSNSDTVTIKTLEGGNSSGLGLDDEFVFTGSKNLTIDTLKTGDGDNKVDFSNAENITVKTITGGNTSGAVGKDDEFLFTGATIKDIGTITLENGDDVLNFKDATITKLGNITGGDGEDKFDFTGAKITAMGNVEGGDKDDTITFDNAEITKAGKLIGNEGNDTISAKDAKAESGLTIYGNNGDDILTGSKGNDTIYGGADKDILTGGEGNDRLEGGAGDDTYHAGNGDIIKDDAKGQGQVYISGIKMTGGTQTSPGSNQFTGNSGETYFYSGGPLKIQYGEQTVIVNGYGNDKLDIHLEYKKEEKDRKKPNKQERPIGSKDCSPIILDLDGNGIKTVGFDKDIHIDHDNDGLKELTCYFDQGDGMLVLDRNENGQIDGGRELFGDNTYLANGNKAPNGFVALAEFDGNYDGMIDSRDSVFERLQVFTDTDQDGIADAGELLSLEEAGVLRLNLGYETSSYEDGYGNDYRQVGSYVNTAGETRNMTDVYFAVDRQLSTEDPIDIPPDIAVLPDAIGYGTVHSLHQSMVRDGSGVLKALVQAFVGSTSRAERLELLKEIVFVWTGTRDMDQNAYPNVPIDTREVEALGAFYGYSIGGPINNSANAYATIFHTEFNRLLDTIYLDLMYDSYLKPVFDHVYFFCDEVTDVHTGSYTEGFSTLVQMIEANPAKGEEIMADFVQCVNGVDPYNPDNMNMFKTQIAEYAESMEGGTSVLPSTIVIMLAATTGATAGNDTLYGKNDADDFLYGYDGNDSFVAGNGDGIRFSGDENSIQNRCSVELVLPISEDYDFIVYKNGNTILIENVLTKVLSFNNQNARRFCLQEKECAGAHLFLSVR